MDKKIKVFKDKTCVPNYITIGYVDEKNVDRLVLDIEADLPRVKWYLLIGDELLPFKNKIMVIDETLTSKPGTFGAYILGSDAPSGKPITKGTQFFNSDRIVLKVRDKR